MCNILYGRDCIYLDLQSPRTIDTQIPRTLYTQIPRALELQNTRYLDPQSTRALEHQIPRTLEPQRPRVKITNVKSLHQVSCSYVRPIGIKQDDIYNTLQTDSDDTFCFQVFSLSIFDLMVSYQGENLTYQSMAYFAHFY